MFASLFIQQRGRRPIEKRMKLVWRTSYRYMLGMVLLLPTAILVSMLWAWRRLRRGRGTMLEEGPPRQLRQGTCEEFTVPVEAVGYVIGRQGQRVREMEESSGARIRFKDQQDSEDKVVVISGSVEAVKAACERVRECVSKVEEKESQVCVGVPVPVYAIGRLIGRGGANIRAIQRESGAKVMVPSGDSGEGSVECEVVGSVVEIDRAVALIQESIQQSELSRRRKALHSRQKTRKPATTPPVEELQLVQCQLPLSNDFFPAFVSAVDRDGTVWLQRVDGSDSAHLDQLVDTMTNDYSKLGPQELLPGEMVEGGVVAAPFPHDQNWYRARAVSIDSSSLSLLFLDFGDTSSVDVSLVKTLRPQYYRLPVQAIPCRLSRIQPKGGNWSDKAIELLDSLTLCATWKVVMVMVEVKGEGRSEVKIVDTTTDKDIDVAEQLVEEGLAEWSMERPLGDGEDSPDSKVPVTLEWVDGRSVSVAGSFSSWEPIPLSRTSSGVYQGNISLPSEGCFQYKFVVDGKWTYNPNQPTVEDGYGGYNNVLNTRTLSLEWNTNSEVCVAGTFSNWQPVPMTKKEGGSYLSTLELPLESSFEYKFVVDGQWEHSDDMPTVNDSFGGHNNVLSTGSPPP